MAIFLSHSHRDAREAGILSEKLETHGFSVFLAPDDIPVSSDWRDFIYATALRADALVVLDSAASRRSHWVQQEVGIGLGRGLTLFPVTLSPMDGGPPGWLGGMQGVLWDRNADQNEEAERVARIVTKVLAGRVPQLPDVLRKPAMVAAYVIGALRQDQHLTPTEHRGAWSRRYEQYLKLHYADDPPRTVSRSASLTFTGLVVSHVSAYLERAPIPHAPHAQALLDRVPSFLRASRDESTGAFGKIAQTPKTRGGAGVEIDLRHTCWAVATMIAIDAHRFRSEIVRACEWLLDRWGLAFEGDRWCWNTAALLAVFLDDRLPPLARSHESAVAAAVKDLERKWDSRHCSWVNEERRDRRGQVSIDNALYVLECVVPVRLVSPRLTTQCTDALERLLEQCALTPDGHCGLPFFPSLDPQPGPTCQLIRLMDGMGRSGTEKLEEYVVAAFSEPPECHPQSFSWHLSAALAVPRLSRKRLDQG